MKSKTSRPIQEINKLFDDKNKYIRSLLVEISKFDLGTPEREERATTLAVSLRVIMHKSRTSIPLLEQLELIEKLFFASNFAPIFGPSQIMRESKLITYKVLGNKGYFVSKNIEKPMIYLSFNNWWDEIVIDNKDSVDNFVTRGETILAIADQEGAHVDPEFDSKNYKICYNKGMDLDIYNNDIKVEFQNNPYKELIISIAQEYINALDLYKQINEKLFFSSEKKISDLILITNYTNSNLKFNLKHYSLWYQDKQTVPGKWLFLNDQFKASYALTNVVKKVYFEKATKRPVFFYILSESNNNFEICVYRDTAVQVLCAYINTESNVVLVRGSIVPSGSSIESRNIEIKNGYSYTKADISFSTIIDLKNSVSPPVNGTSSH